LLLHILSNFGPRVRKWQAAGGVGFLYRFMTAGLGSWSFFKNVLLNSLILLMPKSSGTEVACHSATSCGWWWWKDEEDGKRKQFRWGTTGKKTDNKDFAIKNPDKRGARKTRTTSIASSVP
jgi:hypothetical protein